MGSLYDAWSRGRANGAERAKQSQLAELMGPAMQGDSAAQTKLFGVDQQAGMNAQTFTGNQKKQAADQFGKLSSVWSQTQDQQVYTQWRQAGIAAGVIPATSPEQLTDPKDMEESIKIAQAVAQAFGKSGLGGRVQSRFTNENGEVIALMADGSMVRTGENAAPNIKILEQPGQLPTGYVTSGGRAGSAVSLGGPSQQQGPQQPQGQPPGAYIDPSLPLPVQQQIRDSLSAGREPPPQMYFGGSGAGPGPVRTPTAAENAGSAEAAKIQAQLGFGPQVAQQEALAAKMKAEAEARARADAERGALDATRSRDAGGAIELLNEAEGLLGKATGSGGGALWDSAIGFFGASNEGADATSALKTIAGQLTSKMPRMQGPQSDKDVHLYKEMAGDLANDKLPVSRRRSALQTIRRLNQEYAPGGSKFSNGSPAFGGGAPAGRQIKRTGTINGRKVIQYTDGTTSYAD